MSITRPHAGEHVRRVRTVEGEIDELLSGTVLWLIVEGALIHPNSPIVVKERQFRVAAYIGAEGQDQVVRFDLHIVACSPATGAAYWRYVKTARATNVWEGASLL